MPTVEIALAIFWGAVAVYLNGQRLAWKERALRAERSRDGYRAAINAPVIDRRPDTCWCDGPDCGEVPCIEERGAST